MSTFTWRDAERTIIFGVGRATEAIALAGSPYRLLTTERAQATCPEITARATSVHHVAPGAVDDAARAVEAELPQEPLPLIALGGGRVVDSAKAIGSAHGLKVIAVPTTLSSAEMTPYGRSIGGPPVRPQGVVIDPSLAASQPHAELAASSANMLAHAIEGAITKEASPVPSLAGREAQRLIDSAWFTPDEEIANSARGQLALASMLAGYAIDSAGYGLSHVLSQTLRAITGIPHNAANAIVLPHAILALEERSPGRVDPDGSLAALAERLRTAAGSPTVRGFGITDDQLQTCARAAAQREDLDSTPPRASEEELLALYRAMD